MLGESEKSIFIDSSKDAMELLAAINDSAKTVSALYISFILMLVYAGLVIAGTSDEMFLKNTAVRLPLLNSDVPIIGFYMAVPCLVAVLHIDMLIHFFILARKLSRFQDVIDKKNNLKRKYHIIEQLGSFHYLHLFVSKGKHSIIDIIIKIFFFGSLVVMPIALLLWTQGRFLPYHDVVLTRVQQVAITVDVIAILFFWPLLFPSGRLYFKDDTVIRWSINIILFLVIGMSWLLFTVPNSDPLEVSWLSSCDSANIDQNTLCSWWFNKRNLDLSDQILVANDLTAEQRNVLKGERALDKDRVIQGINGIDLRGRDLRYANFSHSTLLRANLGEDEEGKKTNLEGANLSEANMEGVLAERARMSNSNLNGAKLSNAKFGFADMRKCQINLADLSYTDLHWSDLSEASLSGSTLLETNLIGAKLNKAVLEDTKGEHVSLERANLSGANLKNANLPLSDFRGAKLDGADLVSAELVLSDFSDSTLIGSTLERAILTGLNMKDANLQGADFSGATLHGSSLDGAILSGTDFRYARMQGTVWTNAKLNTTDLREIDLEPLTLKDYSDIASQLSKSVILYKKTHDFLLKMKSIIGKSNNIREIKISGPVRCTNTAFTTGCVSIAEWEGFDLRRANYLADISCDDVNIANRIAHRILEVSRSRYGEASPIARAIIKKNNTNCPGVSKLEPELKKRIERMAEVIE